MKNILQTAVVTVAASVCLAACTPPAPPAEPERAVRTIVVAAGDAGGQHDYAAEVRARTESRLGFRVAGKLASRQADLGDSVKAGQVLARLDPADLRLGVEAAQAALGAARANYEFSAAELKRFRELKEQGFISGWELERRETATAAAKAQFEQATVQASAQGNQARYANLVADASGVITGVDAEPGAVVAAGTPVVRLAHDGPRDVVFSLPEDRVSEVRALVGKPGALKVQLWSDASWLPASLREVAAAADPATRTFLVKADVGRAAVKLGQTATVRIDLPRVAGVVRLPLNAVVERQGGAAVWLLDAATMTVKPQPVRVAGAEGNEVVIAEGLSAGQRVVTAGTHVLTPGQKVRQYVEPKVASAAASTSAR
ncbi:MAG: efflux RND transporter periplasmic adaptor subunit [Burkholderiaceae bacterium]